MVTAQKREQNLQDVGVSVTAMSGEQISALGFTNTIDIAAQVPNLSYQQFHPTLTNINLRGVSQNDFQDLHEPPVATYADGAYISTMGAAHGQMFDLERVEVLRGPQGTLFGRNATGGLLHYISRKPDQETSGYVELTVAEYDQLKIEGAMGGALTESVSGRLSVSTNKHDGWMENRIGTDLNDADSRAIRGQLLFSLTQEADLLVKVHHSGDNSGGFGYNHTPSAYGVDGLGRLIDKNELATFFDFGNNPFQTCQGCDPWWFSEPDNDPRKGAYEETGKFDREVNGLSGTLTWNFSDITLTSITDYFSMDKEFLGDVEGSPNVGIGFHSDQDLEQYSQEVRLQGETDRLTWITGVYYLDIDTDVQHGVEPINIGPFVGANFPGSFVPFDSFYKAEVTTESWAIFGHVEYELSPEFSLITALRYTEDEKELDYTLLNDGAPVLAYNRSITPDAARDWGNVSARVQLDWRANDDTLIYVSYNRGHKAGGFSVPFLLTGPPKLSAFPHDEEVLTSYELGYKGTYLEGSARLNVSLFYYDYSDYQAAFFENFAQIIGNLDAQAYGGEIEVVLNPIEGLELMLGASVLDTEVENVGMPNGTSQNRELPQAADYTLNGLVRYTWPLGGGTLAAQVDFNYVDDTCFTVVCNPSEEEDSYSTSNARLTYTGADGRWSIAAFVRNLTDEDYRVFGLDASFAGFTNSMMNPPRWYGATITYDW